MSDELPPPPPGITLMSPQEFLDRRAAPPETPRVPADDVIDEYDRVISDIEERRLRLDGKEADFVMRVDDYCLLRNAAASLKVYMADAHKSEDRIVQLERERNAWEAKFNAECEKHDATTMRAMIAERELAEANKRDSRNFARMVEQGLRADRAEEVLRIARPEAAPAETPRTNAAILNIGRWWPDDGEPKRLTTNRHDGYGEEDAVTAEFARQLERDLVLALDHIEKDDKEIERLNALVESNPSATAPTSGEISTAHVYRDAGGDMRIAIRYADATEEDRPATALEVFLMCRLGRMA